MSAVESCRAPVIRRTHCKRAPAWTAAKVDIHTPPHLTRASRGELGASIDTTALTHQLSELGRSGNPFFDLATFASASFSGRDVPWTPSVNRIVLGRYLQAIRRNIERVPVLRPRQSRSIRPTRCRTKTIPLDALEVAALLDAARPRDWLPSRDDECDIGMPGEHFCQGPRRVARLWRGFGYLRKPPYEKRGQIVGEVGDTGFARGTHVHFEYHLRGEPHDPYPLFIHPQSRIDAPIRGIDEGP
jgi:hypothetical protein